MDRQFDIEIGDIFTNIIRIYSALTRADLGFELTNSNDNLNIIFMVITDNNSDDKIINVYVGAHTL